MQLRSIEELQIKTVFVYFGPRIPPFFKRGAAVGKILSIDSARNTIHIRTYRSGREDISAPDVDINHLPISWHSFTKSIKTVVATNEYDLDRVTLDLIHDWEDKFDAGEASSFIVPIWEAEKLAREAISQQDIAEYGYILSSYPTRSEKGRFTKVASLVTNSVNAYKRDTER